MKYMGFLYIFINAIIFLFSRPVYADVRYLLFPANLAESQYMELGNSVRRGKRIAAATATAFPPFRTPRWLLATSGFQVNGGFMRSWLLSGGQFCQRLRKKGIAVSQWQPADSGRSEVYECVFEATYHACDSFSSQGLFLIVRGTANGAISSVRAKLSLEDIGPSNCLSQEISEVLGRILSMQNWFKPIELLQKIEKLEELNIEEFGAIVTFSREVTNRANFNLRIFTR